MVSHFPSTFFYPDPCHTANFIVNHEPQSERHVRLITCLAEAISISNRQALLCSSSQLRDELRMADIDLKKLLRYWLMEHDWVLVYNINLYDGVSGLTLPVELESELFDILWTQHDVLLYDVDIEVRCVVVHMGSHRVSIRSYSIESDHRLASVFLLIYTYMWSRCNSHLPIWSSRFGLSV